MASGGRTRSDQANPSDLHIEQDLAFQRRTWAVQRIGWCLMFLLLMAAVAGLFSSGPLSSERIEDPEGRIAVEYERFARYMAPTSLSLVLEPSATGQDRIVIRMNQALSENWDLEHIHPQPERMSAAPDGMNLEFVIAERGKPAMIRFGIKPQTIGNLRGEIGVAGHEPARFNQFVYP